MSDIFTHFGIENFDDDFMDAFMQSLPDMWQDQRSKAYGRATAIGLKAALGKALQQLVAQEENT